ncbi:hypothetical protein DSM112329_04234 [Paraconexibacter sp. AEG42_29]|uniref:Prokaryotic cytochrome C oxidase subunit IV family protein n=1 Tax=Paraconexibacter sp. AEG42_29 TaxID=2997339 RepID=A0AAU7B0E0_9ACTN
MADLLRTRATAVWGVLVLATLLSWWLGTDHGFDDPDAAGALVLAVAFAKLRYVGLDFMEIRDAPRWLRAIFEGWVATVATAVVVMFLVA